MKCWNIVGAPLLCAALLLGGCSAQSVAAGSSGFSAARDPSIPYQYDFTMDDWPEEQRKEFQDLFVFLDTNQFELFDFSYTVDSVCYTDSVENLEQNFYHIPSDVTLSGQKVDDKHTVLLVQMTVTNQADAVNEFAGNDFRVFSLCADDLMECNTAYPFYQDPVASLVEYEYNTKYYRIRFEPGQTQTVTVGFLCDRRILETRNNYLYIGTSGSTSDPALYIPLPGSKEVSG